MRGKGCVSLRVNYPEPNNEKAPFQTVGTRGGPRWDTLLGNQPQRSRVCLFAPGSPLWAWSRCSLGGWEGSWGEGGLAARLVGMRLSGPPPSFWSPPPPGWERGLSGREKAGLFWGCAFLLQKRHPGVSPNRQTDHPRGVLVLGGVCRAGMGSQSHSAPGFSFQSDGGEANRLMTPQELSWGGDCALLLFN